MLTLPSTVAVFTCFVVVSFAHLPRSVFSRVPSPPEHDLPALQRPLDLHDASPSAFDGPQHLLYALQVMQNEYFDLLLGTWPTSIDWTGAVAGTQVSASLSALLSLPDTLNTTYAGEFDFDNTLNKFFSHTIAYFYNENAFALRSEAYDDMLWVVLGWLEFVKFTFLRSELYPANVSWHGTQFSPLAAHRARVFYDLASQGWDTSLCKGGMNWNPRLRPYKNAITNELFIAASVAMYLYFPGDDNDSPYLSPMVKVGKQSGYPAHNPEHLLSAIDAYQWLRNSNMTLSNGLYADGFHITGWHKLSNGTIIPGTEKCDDRNEMVYTYNQGVILSALRGLYIGTGDGAYLSDAHVLVRNVIRATNWPITEEDNGTWAGLGRGGILEDYCDHTGQCSQDGQTFKGIFFGHLADFCRPLQNFEERLLRISHRGGFVAYSSHLQKCQDYGGWIMHNARAASETKDENGRFGMWWGSHFNSAQAGPVEQLKIGSREWDYRNWGHATLMERQEHEYGEYMFKDRKENGNDKDLGDASNEPKDINDRGRGRTVETQIGGLGVLRAAWTWHALLATTREENGP